MKKIFTIIGIVLIASMSAFSQYCEPQATSTGCQYIYVENLYTENGETNISNLNTYCGGSTFVFNSGMKASQYKGSSFDIYMQSQNAYPAGFGVWIDWNQNDDFSDAGEFAYYTTTTTNNELFHGVINVPTDAILGETRMRVRAFYNHIADASESCVNISHGETEDYVFEVLSSDNEFAVTQFIGVNDGYIETSAYTFSIEIENKTISSQSDIPVELTVTNPDLSETVYDFVCAGPVGASSTIIYEMAIDASQAGGYNLSAVTNKMGYSNGFALTSSFSIQVAQTVPFDEYFSSTSPEWWIFDNFSSNTYIGNPWWDDVVESTNLTGDTAAFVSPKIRISDTDFYLNFNFAFNTDEDDDSIRVGDVVEIQIDDNGDDVFETVDIIAYDTNYSYDGSNYPLGYSYDLSAYNGKDIRIRLFAHDTSAVDGTSSVVLSFDDFGVSNDRDIEIEDILYSDMTSCGDVANTIKLAIQNTGNINLTDVPFELLVIYPDGTAASFDATLSSTLAVGERDTITIATVNTTTLEYYSFRANAILEDNNSGNNEIFDNSILYTTESFTAPFYEAFESGQPNYWSDINATFSDGRFRTSGLNNPGEDAYLTTAKYSNITASTKLIFEYYVNANYNSTTEYFMGGSDSIFIQISDDCGQTYIDLAIIDSASHIETSAYQTAEFDLSAYAGKEISVQMYFLHADDAGSTNEIYMYVDNFRILEDDYDFEITQVTPSDYLCGTTTDQVEVTITNRGTTSSSGIPVDLVVTNPEGVDVTYSSTLSTVLAKDESDVLTFTNVNTLIIGGTYNFEAEITADSDTNIISNNTNSSTKEIHQSQDVPYTQRFSSAPTMWIGNNFDWDAGDEDVFTDDLYEGDEAYAITPNIGPITANKFLKLEYKVWTSNGNDTLGGTDNILLEVSNDCGNTYTTLWDIDSASHTVTGGVYNDGVFDLSAYVGDNLHFRITCSKTDSSYTEWFNVDFDNFMVFGSIDASIDDISFSNSTECGSSTDIAEVTIGNNGLTELTDIPVVVKIYLDASIETIFYDTIASLASGSDVTLDFESINTTAAGAYEIVAISMYNDDYTNNDSVTISFNISEADTVPLYESGDNYNDWTKVNVTGTSNLVSSSILEGEQATAVSPKLYIPEEGYIFTYELNTNSDSPIDGDLLGKGDTIEVQVSDDCGVTYTIERVYNPGNKTADTYTLDTISLDAYAGKEIFIRFSSTKVAAIGSSTSWIKFYIDDVKISTIKEFALTMPELTQTNCMFENGQVKVVLENNGASSINSLPVKLTVEIDQYPRDGGFVTSAFYYDTISNLAVSEMDTLIFAINTDTIGEYDFYAEALVTDLSTGDNEFQYSWAYTYPRVYPTDSLPFGDGFKTNTAAHWFGWDIGWNINTGVGELYTPSVSHGDVYSFRTRAIGNISEENHILSFKYKLQNNSTYEFDNGDSIKVLIGNSCDDTFITEYTIDATNQNTSTEYQQINIDLSSTPINGNDYTNDNIFVQIVVESHELVNDNNSGSFVFYLDTLFIGTGIDVTIADMPELAQTYCTFNNNVNVVIENTGVVPVSSIPVELTVEIDKWYGGVVDSIYTDTLFNTIAVGATDTLTFTINNDSIGEYSFTAVSLKDDFNPANNNYNYNAYYNTSHTLPTDETPYKEGFDTNLADDDYWYGWDIDGADWTLANSEIYTDSIYNGEAVSLQTRGIEEVTADYHVLSFRYKIMEDATYLFDEGDSIEVMISNDCENFTTEYIIDASNHDTTTEYQYASFDLANTPLNSTDYTGDKIFVKFVVANNDTTSFAFTFYMDTLFVGTGTDITIVELVRNERDDCGFENDIIGVSVANIGPIEVNSIDVNVNMYGMLNTTLSTQYTNALASGDTVTIPLENINTSLPGNYEYVIEVSTADDIDSTNNELTDYFTIVEPELPEDFYENYGWTAQLEPGENEFISWGKVGAIEEDHYLTFKFYYRSDSLGTETIGLLRNGDKVSILVSEDCGYSYDTITIADSSNTRGYGKPFGGIDLSDYIGKDIIVGMNFERDAASDTLYKVRYYSSQTKIEKPNVGIYDVINPDLNDRYCGLSQDSVSVVVYNYGNVTIDSIPVVVEVNGEDFYNTMISNTLYAAIEPGDRDTLFVGYINSSIPGDYEMLSYVDYEFVTNNDSVVDDFTILEPTEVPYYQDFDMVPGWDYTNMTFALNILSTNELIEGDTAIIETESFGTINENNYLAFEYKIIALDNASDELGNYLRDQDTIMVMISDDCGETFFTEEVLNSSNHIDSEDYQRLFIDLAAYAGDDIIIRIEAAKAQTGKMQLLIDNFVITGEDSVSVVDLVSDETLCGSTNYEIGVIVQNYSFNSLSNIPVGLDIYEDGDLVTTLYDTLLSTLAYNETDTLYFSSINTTVPQDYDFEAYTTLTPHFYLNSQWESFTTEPLLQVPYDNSWYPSIFEADRDTVYTQTFGDDKVGPISADNELILEYRIRAYDNSNSFLGYYVKPEDAINFMISDDCGETYDIVHTVNSSNHIESDSDTTVYVSLAEYVGKNIFMKVEAVNNDIGNYRLYLSNFEITVPDANFATAIEFAQKQENANRYICGLASDSLYVEFTNNGNYDLTNIAIDATITEEDYENDVQGETEISTLFTGTVEVDSTEMIFVGMFSSINAGTYEYDVETTVDGQSTTNNNTFEVDTMRSFPYANNFSVNPETSNNWELTDFSWSAATLYSYLDEGESATFYSPKFESVQSGYVLSYDYLINSGEFDLEDSIAIYVSSDCGSSYQLIDVFTDPDNIVNYPNGWNTRTVELDEYVGLNLIFKGIAVNNYSSNNDFSIKFDNFKIDIIDASIVDITTLNDIHEWVVCGEALDSIYVEIENTGGITMENVPVKVYKNNVLENYTLTESIDPGDTKVLYIGTINTSISGVDNIVVIADVANDHITTNDELHFSITTQNAYPLPYEALSGSNFGEDNFWRQDGNLNPISTGNDFIRTTAGGLSAVDTAYAITPKITGINANSYLVFDYDATNTVYGHIIYGEQILVKVSTDCSDNFELVYTIDVNNSDSATQNITKSINIGQYAGNDIRVKFELLKSYSMGDFYVNIDNIVVTEFIPVEIIASDEYFVPNGPTIQLNAGSYYDNYEWRRELYGDNVQSWNQVYTINQAGTYSVEVEKYGIVSYDTIVIFDSIPVPGYITSDDTLICNNEITAHSVPVLLNVDHYIWNIYPSNSGMIKLSGIMNESIEIDWNDNYTGAAKIMVNAVFNTVDVSDTLSLDLMLDPCIGIAEMGDGLAYNVFPNPANNNLTIQLNDINEAVRINIYDAIGKLVLSKEVYDNKTELDVSELFEGIYFMELIGSSYNSRTKIIIER